MTSTDADPEAGTTLQKLIGDIRHNIGDSSATIYIGIYRCGGSVAIPEGRSTIYGLGGNFGRLYVIAESVFVTANDGARVPVHLRYMTLSSGPSMGEAADYVYNMTARVNTIFQVSANAPSDTLHETLFLEHVLGDVEDRCRETPFYGAPPYPQVSRELNKEATAALINAVWGHDDSDRITRAMAQYETALGHWKTGGRPLALMHLYMGVEALTEALLRQELKVRKCTENDLMAEFSIDPGRSTAKGLLRARLRLHRVFDSDEETYKRARDFSDSLEHGFGDAAALWGVPPEVHEKTAFYLRSAIIKLVSPKGDAGSILLSPPYDTIPHSLEPPHYFTRVSIDQMQWREREFTAMALSPVLTTMKYDQEKLEYTPIIAFQPTESSPPNDSSTLS